MPVSEAVQLAEVNSDTECLRCDSWLPLSSESHACLVLSEWCLQYVGPGNGLEP